MLKRPLWQPTAMSWPVMSLLLDASERVRSILNANLDYYVAAQALWINVPSHSRDYSSSKVVLSLDVVANLGTTGATNWVFRRYPNLMEGIAGYLVPLLCLMTHRPVSVLAPLSLREGNPLQPIRQVDPHLSVPRWVFPMLLGSRLIIAVVVVQPYLPRPPLRYYLPGRCSSRKLSLLPIHLRQLSGQ